MSDQDVELQYDRAAGKAVAVLHEVMDHLGQLVDSTAEPTLKGMGEVTEGELDGDFEAWTAGVWASAEQIRPDGTRVRLVVEVTVP